MKITTTVLVALALAFVSGDASAQRYADELADLTHPDAGKRRKAAIELRSRHALSGEAVDALIIAARREENRKAYVEILLTLGKSGAMEARPMIDQHVLSADSWMRKHARNALRLWLVRNGLLGGDDDLPDPPHALYGPPPQLNPDAPAARPMFQASAVEGPVYLPPPPGVAWAYRDGDAVEAVAPGFTRDSEPIPALWITGVSTFLPGYFVAAGAAAINESRGTGEYAAAIIPIAGPWVALAQNDSFSKRNKAEGLLLVGSGVLQAGGAALFITAFAAPRTIVVKAGPQSVAIQGAF